MFENTVLEVNKDDTVTRNISVNIKHFFKIKFNFQFMKAKNDGK